MAANILPEIVKSTVKEAEKTWSSFFKTSKTEMKKQSDEAKEQSKRVEASILESKRQQAVENIEREKRKRNVLLRNIPESSQTELKDQELQTEQLVQMI